MTETPLRRMVFGLLLIVSMAWMGGRVTGVENVYEPSVFKAYPKREWPKVKPEPMPTFASNDRSRWSTVRALVEEGTFVIGHRIDDPTNPKGYRDEGIGFQDGYKSVDVVMKPTTKEFFSTKPPLLTCAVAVEYWILRNGLGWQMQEKRWEVVVVILWTFNILPLVISLILLMRLLEEYGQTDWGRIFVFTIACFATFLTTFAITLNNHTPAACCIMFALYPFLRGAKDRLAGELPKTRSVLISAFFAGVAVCLDLPSAAFAAALGGLYFLKSRKTLLYYVPMVLFPIGLQFYLNFLAIGEWTPVYDKFGGPWYEYEGSHWAKRHLIPKPDGIDFADEPKTVYAFHMLFGHHGLFSLSPVWLLLFIPGLRAPANTSARPGLFSVQDSYATMRKLTYVLAAVVVGFYIFKSNNYGGWTSGLRWLFWLTPLFLLTILPAADRLGQSRRGRGFAYVFLAISIFSTTFPVWNPWRHPWIYQACEYFGWLRY